MMSNADTLNDEELEEFWQTQRDALDSELLEGSVKVDEESEKNLSKAPRQEGNHVPIDDERENISSKDQKERISSGYIPEEGPGGAGIHTWWMWKCKRLARQMIGTHDSNSEASPNLPSSPKWDRTPGALNILNNSITSEDSEDERPLSWKGKSNQNIKTEKLEAKGGGGAGGSSTRYYFNQEDEGHDKAINDDVVVGVMFQRSKVSRNKEDTSNGSKTVKRSSKRKVVVAPKKRKQWEVYTEAEEEEDAEGDDLALPQRRKPTQS
ncbi:hypothetical protein HAX54_033999 [Datura stramonium]|uniref:Uncharacterized protein n=1 Tax=Datura stramonium TaxID=4076 RepID=A0ABS8VEL2_DATST|nr:hypothetical protein [Datura stramonium]